MRSPLVRRLSLKPSHRRAGLLPAKEIIVVVAILAILCWASSRLVFLPDDEMAAHAATSRACSDRPVYRLAMEETGNRLWMFRPSQEVTGLNLTSGEIDKSRSSLGISLTTVAHSRDGTTSLLVTQDNSIYLDREGSDFEWEKLSGEDFTLVDVAVSNDGSVALVALSDGTVRGWNVVDEQAEAFGYRFPNRQNVIRMCLDGEGLRLFAGFGDGSASLHEAMTGKLLCDTVSLNGNCRAAVWSEDGRRIAVATVDGAIGLIDGASGQRVWHTKSSDTRRELDHVTALAISPDGHWLAACGMSTKCIVWDVTASNVARKLSGHDGLVRTIAFSPNTRSLFTGGLDGTIREWSMETFAPLRKFD